MPPRVAIYSRISRDDLGDGAGVARQEEDCRALCARRGWIIARSFVDNDFSAFSGRQRPAYAQLMECVRRGDADVVVAWAPERLHRSLRELEDFIELVEKQGTQVETVKAGTWDVTTSHGRLVARMLGAVSRAESERTGERVSRAHQQAIANGLWRGAIPFGMRQSPERGLLEPDPETAPLVRGILARVLQGDALTRIARELNESGSRPRRGRAWTHTGIDRLIGSPAIGGLIHKDGELVPAAFDGLVSPNDWRAARAALARRPRGERRRPRETLTLLGGFLRCAEHDEVCFGGSRDGTPVYSAGSHARCYVGIPRQPVDLLVKNLVVERLKRPDAADLLAQTAEAEPLEVEAAALRQRREEITELLGDGLLAASVARQKLVDIAQRLSEIEARLEPAAMPAELLIDPEAAWEAWSIPQRRELLRLLFSAISVSHAVPSGPRVDLNRVSFAWAS